MLVRRRGKGASLRGTSGRVEVVVVVVTVVVLVLVQVVAVVAVVAVLAVVCWSLTGRV